MSRQLYAIQVYRRGLFRVFLHKESFIVDLIRCAKRFPI